MILLFLNARQKDKKMAVANDHPVPRRGSNIENTET